MARIKGNAVAGVKARNGVKKGGPLVRRTGARDKADPPVLASALTAVLTGDGMVVCVLGSQIEARAFLRERRA